MQVSIWKEKWETTEGGKKAYIFGTGAADTDFDQCKDADSKSVPIGPVRTNCKV